jgi:hypothetical protein
MKRSITRLAVPVIFCLFICSCGGDDQSRKETFAVQGEVFVDGQPAEQVAIRCIDVAGIDKEAPTTSAAFTDEDGKFEISTYESADGVPEGEYVLTFEWGQWNAVSGAYGGPDKLKNRYKDPRKSQTRFKVEKGKPTDLGRIELSSK